MRKHILAFAMIFSLAFESVSMSLSARAAGDDGNYQVILENKYADWRKLDHSFVFSTKSLLRSDTVYTADDSVIIVDESGNMTEISNRNTDGSVKYKNVNWHFNNGVAFVKPDDNMLLLTKSGRWIDNNGNGYSYIIKLDDNRYLVCNGSSCNIIDESENVIASDVARGNFVLSNDMYLPVEEYCGYYFVKLYDAGIRSEQIIILDGSFKRRNVTVDGGYDYIQSVCTGFYKNTVDIYTVGGASGSYTISLDNFSVIDTQNNSSLVSGYMSNSDIETYSSPGIGYVICTRNGQKLYGYDDIAERLAERLNITEEQTVWSTPAAIGNGCLYLEVRKMQGNSMIDKMCAVLKKETGYSIDSAEIFDLEERDYIWTNSTGDGRFCEVHLEGCTYVNDMKLGATKDWCMEVGSDTFCVRYNGSSKMDFYTYSGRKLFSANGEIAGYRDGESVLIRRGDGGTDAYSYSGKLLYSTSEKLEYFGTNGWLVTLDGSSRYGLKGPSTVQKPQEGNETEKITDKTVTTETTSKPSQGETVLDTSQGNTADNAGGASEETTTVAPTATNETSITVGDNEPVKSDILSDIKGRDIILTIETESGAKWKIKGSDITGDSLKDIDLTVQNVRDVIPNDAISAIKLEGENFEISLAHTGEFGFTAELIINLKEENKDKYANLFYYNPGTKLLEFMECVKISENGDAGFRFSHASDYVIIVSDTEYKTVEPETTSEAATDTKSESDSEQASENKSATGVYEKQDGDSGSSIGIVVLIIVLCAAAGAGVVLFVRKRKDGEIQQKKLI